MNSVGDRTEPLDVARDMELAEALSVIDPARIDPNYWLRFRSWVMGATSRELARRRLRAELTVGDVMTSWARTGVPAAMAAAVIAALLLARGNVLDTPLPVGVEELLLTDIEGETIPQMFEAEEAEAVAFASEVF